MIARIKRKLYKATHPIVGEIWMLHRVVERRSEKPEQRALEVTPDWLEQKILEYRQKGYRIVSIDEAAEILERIQLSTVNCKLSTFITLTFDDGYSDNYTLAYPLLKRLGIPFTVYVSTGFIDNKQEMWWYPGEQLGMSSNELKEMNADPLCTIGAHAVNHLKLDTLTREQQYKEISESKQTLETLFGHEVKHFSFPHGAHNTDTLAICRELGFKTVVQSWGGPIRKGAHYDVLPRISMTQND